MIRSTSHIIKRVVPVFVLFAINIIAYFFHGQKDLTSENRYTISKGTKDLLLKVNKPLTIKVLLKGPYPSGFKKLGNNAEDLLRKFRDIAGPSFQYEIISPEDNIPQTDKTYAEVLDAMGVSALSLTSQIKQGQQQVYIYPLALLEYQGKIELVQLYKGKSPLISKIGRAHV